MRQQPRRVPSTLSLLHLLSTCGESSRSRQNVGTRCGVSGKPVHPFVDEFRYHPWPGRHRKQRAEGAEQSAGQSRAPQDVPSAGHNANQKKATMATRSMAISSPENGGREASVPKAWPSQDKRLPGLLKFKGLAARQNHAPDLPNTSKINFLLPGLLMIGGAGPQSSALKHGRWGSRADMPCGPCRLETSP